MDSADYHPEKELFAEGQRPREIYPSSAPYSILKSIIEVAIFIEELL